MDIDLPPSPDPHSDSPLPTEPPFPSQPVFRIVLTTVGGQPRFDDFETAARVAAALASPRLWRDGQLLAWVLLPDQWHGLLVPAALDSLPTAIARARSAAVRAVGQREPIQRLWAPGHQQQLLLQPRAAIAVARELVALPMRAGLATSPAAYTFWDAVWLR